MLRPRTSISDTCAGPSSFIEYVTFVSLDEAGFSDILRFRPCSENTLVFGSTEEAAKSEILRAQTPFAHVPSNILPPETLREVNGLFGVSVGSPSLAFIQ